MISPLCDFAHWFSAQVAHDLESARRERHQMRETSWTDRMLLELKRLRDPRILVKSSNEPATGADMEWWFIRADGAQHLCLTVQAKILDYAARDPALWAYPELRHPHRAMGRQARKLRAHATLATKRGRATIPLYIFYNPAAAVHQLAPWWELWPLPGATLANGRRVVRHLESNRSGHHIPRDVTRAGTIGSMMFPLEWVFCRGGGDPPSPEEVADAMEGAEHWIDEKNELRRPRRGASVAPGDGVPAEIAGTVARLRSEWASDAGSTDAPSELDDPARGQPSRVFFVSGEG